VGGVVLVLGSDCGIGADEASWWLPFSSKPAKRGSFSEAGEII
jgi:hypothetical protein